MNPEMDNYDENPQERPENESLAEFIENFNIPDGFKVAVSRCAGPGELGQLRTFSQGEHHLAEPEEIGKEYGPGTYKWIVTAYVPKDKRGNTDGKARIIQSFTRQLAGDFYEREWIARQRKRAERENVNKIDKVGEQIDPNELAEKAIANAQKLAGMMLKTPEKDNTPLFIAMMEQQKQNADNTLQMMLAQSQQNMQMVMAMMTGMQQTMATMLTANTSKPQGDEMGMIDKSFGYLHRLMELKGAIEPPAPESTVEKLVSIASDNLPTLLELAGKTLEERKRNIAYRMASQHPMIEAVAKDPEAKDKAVEMMAHKIGLENTAQVLEVLDWPEHKQAVLEALAPAATSTAESSLD